MKTRFLIIIGIVSVVAVYLPIHYYYPFLGIGTTTRNFIFCEEGFIQMGQMCQPDPNLLESNTVIIDSITDSSHTFTEIVPHNLVIHLDKDNKITWVNKGIFTTTVHDLDGKWSTGKIQPSKQKSIYFNRTGFYDYIVDTIYQGTGGDIVVLSNETNSLPLDIKMKMGMSIVSSQIGKNPALIGVGIGSTEKGVMITINQDEIRKYDDAESFYHKMYKDLIPFEVPIIIDFSTPAVPTDSSTNKISHTNSTNTNPYGIEAKVMVQSTYFSPPIQQDEPIKPQDVLWFRYNTNEIVSIIDFTICKESDCISYQPADGPPLQPDSSAKIDSWGGGTLGDLAWKIGDSVHTWVNTRPVHSSENGDLIDLNDPVSRFDLGESKITRGDTMRI